MHYDGMQGDNQSRFLHALYNVALVSKADAAQWKGAQEKRAPLRMDWGQINSKTPRGCRHSAIDFCHTASGDLIFLHICITEVEKIFQSKLAAWLVSNLFMW